MDNPPTKPLNVRLPRASRFPEVVTSVKETTQLDTVRFPQKAPHPMRGHQTPTAKPKTLDLSKVPTRKQSHSKPVVKTDPRPTQHNIKTSVTNDQVFPHTLLTVKQNQSNQYPCQPQSASKSTLKLPCTRSCRMPSSISGTPSDFRMNDEPHKNAQHLPDGIRSDGNHELTDTIQRGHEERQLCLNNFRQGIIRTDEESIASLEYNRNRDASDVAKVSINVSKFTDFSRHQQKGHQDNVSTARSAVTYLDSKSVSKKKSKLQMGTISTYLQMNDDLESSHDWQRHGRVESSLKEISMSEMITKRLNTERDCSYNSKCYFMSKRNKNQRKEQPTNDISILSEMSAMSEMSEMSEMSAMSEVTDGKRSSVSSVSPRKCPVNHRRLESCRYEIKGRSTSEDTIQQSPIEEDRVEVVEDPTLDNYLTHSEEAPLETSRHKNIHQMIQGRPSSQTSIYPEVNIQEVVTIVPKSLPFESSHEFMHSPANHHNPTTRDNTTNSERLSVIQEGNRSTGRNIDMRGVEISLGQELYSDIRITSRLPNAIALTTYEDPKILCEQPGNHLVISQSSLSCFKSIENYPTDAVLYTEVENASTERDVSTERNQQSSIHHIIKMDGYTPTSGEFIPQIDNSSDKENEVMQDEHIRFKDKKDLVTWDFDRTDITKSKKEVCIIMDPFVPIESDVQNDQGLKNLGTDKVRLTLFGAVNVEGSSNLKDTPNGSSSTSKTIQSSQTTKPRGLRRLKSGRSVNDVGKGDEQCPKTVIARLDGHSSQMSELQPRNRELRLQLEKLPQKVTIDPPSKYHESYNRNTIISLDSFKKTINKDSEDDSDLSHALYSSTDLVTTDHQLRLTSVSRPPLYGSLDIPSVKKTTILRKTNGLSKDALNPDVDHPGSLVSNEVTPRSYYKDLCNVESPRGNVQELVDLFVQFTQKLQESSSKLPSRIDSNIDSIQLTGRICHGDQDLNCQQQSSISTPLGGKTYVNVL